ncbi:hypothetical protein H8B09_00800 [Paenibacillus sp. PR3]|uniref:DUF2642 domain-containing protein n=1 Tax=Paenibacillus terricola TaxID=2763503 RepID=A0ABR8MMN7_9BACL|nr:hypothetical protein [Paenibacillus terricola]MBD3917276.1 hypothetical protein [Paenibacillus terricola]
MGMTLSGQLSNLLGNEVTVVTIAYGQLSVIGTLTQVGSDYATVSFEDSGVFYNLNIPFVNIAYVHQNPI